MCLLPLPLCALRSQTKHIMKTKSLFIFAVLSYLLLSSTSTAKVVDRIVAKVNDDIITLSDLKKNISIMQELNENEFNKKVLSKTFKSEKEKVLNKMIEEKLHLQYAKKQHIVPSKGEIDNTIEEIKKNNNFTDDLLEMMLKREDLTLEKYRTKLKERIAISKAINMGVKSRIKVNEKEVISYYNKNKKNFLKPEAIKVRHILFLVDDKMNRKEAKKQKKKAMHVLELSKRGDNFEELAKIHSEGPSRDTGGDLGWIKKGEMIPSFEKTAFALIKGDISNLVKTKFGYHIIKVEDKKKPTIKTLDEARDEVQKILFKEKFDTRYNTWMAELKKKSFIEVFLEDKPKKKRLVRISTYKAKADKKISRKYGINNSKNVKVSSKSINTRDKIKVSKFILEWEKTRETKNRKRYISFYSKDSKINGLSRKEWKKTIEKEYEKYKFIKIEIRNLRISKRNKFYIATFDQSLKSNISNQIRLVRLYLIKDKNGLKIAQEKWLNSPYSSYEFSKKPLLSFDTLPHLPSKLSKKTKTSHIVQPLGLLK